MTVPPVAEGLSIAVARAFYGQFTSLRQAQRDAIGPILAGEDVLVLSGTGSGKTEAVTAPVVESLMRAGRHAVGVKVVYLTPTRALANDLVERLQQPLAQLDLRVGIRHGERNDLSRVDKPDVLITTPESLDVLLTSRSRALDNICHVIVDEAHLFYNTQRGFQLGVLIRRLEALVKRELPVAALSATVADADQIWAFLRPRHQPTVVLDPSARQLDYLLRSIGGSDALVDLFHAICGGGKSKVLVFTNSRREADQIAELLRSRTVASGRVFAHHSSMSKSARRETEVEFALPGTAVCVATSTLELGIDIGDIDLVVLYGYPGGWESFLQRVGRGNRRSQKTNVVALTDPSHGPVRFQQLSYEALIRKVRAGAFDRERALTLYGAGVQQILSMLVERSGAFSRVEDLCEPLTAWPGYSRDVFDAMLDRLADAGMVRRHGFQDRVGSGPGLHRLQDMRLLWGNFPGRSREVVVSDAGREIARVPAANLIRLAPSNVFSLGGRRWVVTRLTADRIDVRTTKHPATATLSYGGSRRRVDPWTLEAILELIDAQAPPEGLGEPERAAFQIYLNNIADANLNSLPYQRTDNGTWVYFTFAGEIVNRVIAEACEVEVVRSGDVFVETVGPLNSRLISADPRSYERIASSVMDSPLDLTIYQGLLPNELLKRELAQVWNLTPVVARALARLREATPVQVWHVDFDSLLV